MVHRFVSRRTLLVASTVALAACSQNTQTPATTTPQPAASRVAALPDGVTPQMIATGDSIFKAGSCQRCHGMDAKGKPGGPDLTDNIWSQIGGTYPEIVQLVTDGVPKEKIKLPTAQNAMRPRGGQQLTDDQIRAVSAYVYSLSHR